MNHMSRPCCPGPCAGPARSPRHLISTRVVLPQMGPHRRAFRGCWTWHRSLHFDQLVRAPSNLATPLPPGRRNRPWHDLTALLTPPRSCALVSHATLDMHARSSPLGRSSSATPGRIWTIPPAEDICFLCSCAHIDCSGLHRLLGWTVARSRSQVAITRSRGRHTKRSSSHVWY